MKSINSNDTEGVNRIGLTWYQTSEVINSENEEGDTPSHIATAEGRVDCLNSLIESGADINKTNKSGLTPAHFATINGHANCLRLLKNNGADISDRSYLKKAIENNTFVCVEILLSKALPDEKQEGQKFLADYPLHLAIEKNNRKTLPSLVQSLIDEGNDVNKRDPKKNSPCHYAAKLGNLECIKKLQSNGASMTVRNSDNETPASLAFKNGHKECLLFLIQHTVDAATTIFPTLVKYATVENLQFVCTNDQRNNFRLELKFDVDSETIKFMDVTFDHCPSKSWTLEIKNFFEAGTRLQSWKRLGYEDEKSFHEAMLTWFFTYGFLQFQKQNLSELAENINHDPNLDFNLRFEIMNLSPNNGRKDEARYNESLWKTIKTNCTKNRRIEGKKIHDGLVIMKYSASIIWGPFFD
jgi:ankyrin repeat protein